LAHLSDRPYRCSPAPEPDATPSCTPLAHHVVGPVRPQAYALPITISASHAAHAAVMACRWEARAAPSGVMSELTTVHARQRAARPPAAEAMGGHESGDDGAASPDHPVHDHPVSAARGAPSTLERAAGRPSGCRDQSALATADESSSAARAAAASTTS